MEKLEALCKVRDDLIAAKEQETWQQQALIKTTQELNDLSVRVIETLKKELAAKTEQMEIQSAELRLLKVCLCMYIMCQNSNNYGQHLYKFTNCRYFLCKLVDYTFYVGKTGGGTDFVPDQDRCFKGEGNRSSSTG